MAARRSAESYIPVEHVALFRSVRPQLTSLLSEIRELSKKHPDGAINKFKLGFINEKLRDANRILGESYKPLTTFEQFSADDLPSNSDVVLILAQYGGALNRWQEDHVYRDQSQGKVWRTNPPLPA